MNLTEFIEYIIDNSDGPVTFSIAGAKVSINLEGDQRETKPSPFGKAISLTEAREIALRASKKNFPNMREVTERAVRAANNLGPEYIAGHSVPGYPGGAATEFLKRRKIPYKIFYTKAGRGTKMSFVNKENLK